MESFAAIIERPPSIYSDSSTDPTHPTREFPPTAAATESPLEYVDPFFSTNLPLSPRVRTDSVTSSVSSFQSSYLEGFSPDTSASTYYPAREPVTTTSRLTIDRSGRGFVVETSVSGVASAIVVEWDQLVQLLVNPETLSTVSPEHPIARASALLASLPAPSQPLELVNLEPVGDNPMEPLSARFGHFGLDVEQPHNFNANGSESLDAPETAHPFRSNFPAFGPPRVAFDHNSFPELPVPPVPASIDPRRFSASDPAPRPERARSRHDDHVLPKPSARLLRRADSDYGAHAPFRRVASSPYARPASVGHGTLPQAHLSTSSLQDFAGPASSAASFRSLKVNPTSLSSSEANKTPTVESKPLIARGRGPNRRRSMLNETSERYAWSFHKAQLFRLVDDAPRGETMREVGWSVTGEVVSLSMEEIVFPSGSYFRCFDNDVEILPSDATSRVNDFLRAQHCVAACNFRFQGKRPSVIRHHVISCKARARELNVDGDTPDPLKRLCELQLEAQQTVNKQRDRQGPPLDVARCQAADGFDYATVRGEMRQDGSSLESAIKSLENHGEDESDFDLGSGGGADDSTSIRSLDSLESPSGISSRRRRPTRPLSLAESTRSGPTCDESSPRSLDVAADTGSSSRGKQTHANWWTTKRFETDDPIRAIVDASASSPLDDLAPAVTREGVYPAGKEPDWLSSYGLKTPTLSSALESQQQHSRRMRPSSGGGGGEDEVEMKLDSPNQRDSFLAMD